jgi:pyridine nucleotide-disulfide oxidoreductase
MKHPVNTFHGFYEAQHVFRYLDDFAQKKEFAGKTIKERIIFGATVKTIKKEDHQWMVQVDEAQKFHCRKLIMATGLTSTPKVPNFSTNGSPQLILHSKQLAQEFQLVSSPKLNHFVVLGGGKSAFDAVQMLCKLEKSVTWVIRTDGTGPAHLATPNAPALLKNSHEIISLRFVAKMSPCIFEPLDGWTRFFHQTKAGSWFTSLIWSLTQSIWHRDANYSKNSNLSKLKPDRPVFWSSDNIAVSNSPLLWDTVSKATIYRDSIGRLEESTVVLKSGLRLKCDALICCTGWNPCYPMFSHSQALGLGLPLPLGSISPVEPDDWVEKLATADEKVVKDFPSLANSPKYPVPSPSTVMSRLYRGMIPITGNDRSIVFLGQVGTTQSMTIAEIQSLWAVAHLTGKLDLPTEPEMADQVALATAWRRRRYLSDGNTFIFEQIQV